VKKPESCNTYRVVRKTCTEFNAPQLCNRLQ